MLSPVELDPPQLANQSGHAFPQFGAHVPPTAADRPRHTHMRIRLLVTHLRHKLWHILEAARASGDREFHRYIDPLAANNLGGRNHRLLKPGDSYRRAGHHGVVDPYSPLRLQ